MICFSGFKRWKVCSHISIFILRTSANLSKSGWYVQRGSVIVHFDWVCFSACQISTLKRNSSYCDAVSLPSDANLVRYGLRSHALSYTMPRIYSQLGSGENVSTRIVKTEVRLSAVYISVCARRMPHGRTMYIMPAVRSSNLFIFFFSLHPSPEVRTLSKPDVVLKKMKKNELAMLRSHDFVFPLKIIIFTSFIPINMRL